MLSVVTGIAALAISSIGFLKLLNTYSSNSERSGR